MFLDLHCHSKYSRDAITSPQHIAEIAKKNNFVVALTDHNNNNGWRAYEAACKELNIDYILGQEQKVFWEDGFAGELLFLFLNGEIKSTGVMDAIDEARSQDAFVSVAHPFDRFRKFPKNGSFRGIEKIIKKIDAVEVFNSRCITMQPNRKAMKLAMENSLGMTAGSDAHLPREVCRGYIEAKADSLEGVRKLLKKGAVETRGRLSSPMVHFETQLVKRGLLKKETD